MILKMIFMNHIFMIKDWIKILSEANNFIDGYNLIKLNTNKSKVFVDSVNFKNTYAPLLYPGEYEHSKNYLNNFCDNTSSFKSKKLKEKKNSIRFMTYNVHAFINSCNWLKNNDIKNDKNKYEVKDVNSIFDISSFIANNNIDIVFLQEYAAIHTKQDVYLDTFFNMCNDFSEKLQTNKFVDFNTCKIDNCQQTKQTEDNFFGQFTMSKFPIWKIGIIGKLRCFLVSKIKIVNIDVLFINIHPDSENKNEQDMWHNHNQIKDALKDILYKYDLNKTPILIAGDCNTSLHHTLKLFSEYNFINVRSFLANIHENEYSGYYGSQIDYICVSPCFLTKFKINYYVMPNINYSDHLPLIIDFELISQKIRQTNAGLLSIPRQLKNLRHVIPNHDLQILNDIIFDLHAFIERHNYDLITLPENTYLVHSTVSEKIFEIEYIQNFPISFTHIFFSSESFMAHYGNFTKQQFKR